MSRIPFMVSFLGLSGIPFIFLKPMLRVHTWLDGPAEDSKRKLTNRSTLGTGGCIGITRTLISARARSQNGRFHTFLNILPIFRQGEISSFPPTLIFLDLTASSPARAKLCVKFSDWTMQVGRNANGFLKKTLKKSFRYPFQVSQLPVRVFFLV